MNSPLSSKKQRKKEEIQPKPEKRLRAPFGFDLRLRNLYDLAFICLLVPSLILRVIWLDLPIDSSDPLKRSSLIFDEVYYVNVARKLLGIPTYPADKYANEPFGVDPNKEHPPLAKLIITLSMKVLGDNAWGWRLPTIVFGMASIFLFYLLMKRVSKSPRMALLASFLFSFDNLVFAHSRIATLDIFVLAFMLLGFYWYFRRRMGLSAFALALSTLCKIGGLYGFATIVAYHFLRDIHGARQPERKVKKRRREERLAWYDRLRILIPRIFTKEKFRWLERYLIIYAVSGLIILFILDRMWAGFSNPIDHMIFIYQYTLGLKSTGSVAGESYPWQWLLNEAKITYTPVMIELPSNRVIGYLFPTIVGAMNPLIIYLCLPTMAYTAYAYYKRGSDLPAFILAWFFFTYLPFYPLSIVGKRVSYLFYFLNTVPSVCAAISFTLLNRNTSKTEIILYLIAVLAGFTLLFPYKKIP